jgi:hypothetical protein
MRVAEQRLEFHHRGGSVLSEMETPKMREPKCFMESIFEKDWLMIPPPRIEFGNKLRCTNFGTRPRIREASV